MKNELESHSHFHACDQIVDALLSVGVLEGQAVLVHSSLRLLGKIKGIAKNDTFGYCAKIYNSFDVVLGLKKCFGTILVPTFTHDYVRKKTPFILSKTPSEMGIFSEFVRAHPESIRTLHPIASLAVIGKDQNIFRNISRSAYGLNSAFDKLVKIPNSRLVYLGASSNHTTLMHHLEHLVGVSYMYNKAYFSPDVFINSRERVDIPFFSGVRYLNGMVETNYLNWGNEMIERGLMLISYIGDFKIMSCRISDAMEVGYEMLQSNPCAFLESPYYQLE